jgi:hypothetical protein
MKILAAALLYFAIVFGAGFVLGPVRVLFIEPRVGATVAVLLETPVLLAAMIIGARIAVRFFALGRSGAVLLSVGALALVVQQVADVAVAVLLRGMMVADHIAQFTSAAGMVYAALLVAFVVMPWMVGRGPNATAR